MTTSGESINLSFAYTCRAIYDELWERAFKLNNIIFHTAFCETNRQDAGLWHGGISKLDLYKENLVDLMARRYMTTAIEDEIATSYPQFKPILSKWRAGGEVTWFSNGHDWGETPSIYRDFISHALKVLAKHPKFPRKNTDWTRNLGMPQDRRDTYCNVLELINFHPDPWTIPNAEDLRHLQYVSGVTTRSPRFYNDTVKYRLSAASTAIRFLENPPMMVRKHIRNIRNIKLMEDRESIAHPECHMRGLIPFCRELPGLRIERSINLWTTAYPFHEPHPWQTVRWDNDTFARARVNWSMPPRIATKFGDVKCVSRAIARWMTEASALQSLGMLPGAFTLLFDGNPCPELAHHIFRTVFQRDAAWQTALDMSYGYEAWGGLLQPSWFERRRRLGYMYEDSPRLVRDMNVGGALIRCNFDIGHELSAEKIAAELQYSGIGGWEKRWHEHQISWDNADLQPFHPLPDWRALRGEHLIPT